MHSQDEIGNIWEITFHYINGETEAFQVYNLFKLGTTATEVRQEIRHFINQEWWTIKTIDETIFIKSANILRFEVKPPLESIEGEGVISEAERVTALSRSNR
jgi:hypothetical protein